MDVKIILAYQFDRINFLGETEYQILIIVILGILSSLIVKSKFNRVIKICNTTVWNGMVTKE